MASKLNNNEKFVKQKHVYTPVSKFRNTEGETLFRPSTRKEKSKNEIKKQKKQIQIENFGLEKNLKGEKKIYSMLERHFNGGASCAEQQYELVRESLKKIEKEDNEFWNKETTNEKHHDWVKKYLYSLFKYVGEQFCFEKGSFVIKDDNFKLCNFLFEQSDPVKHGIFFKTSVKNKEMPRIFMSHTAYLNEDKSLTSNCGKYGNVYEIHMYGNDIIIKSGCNNDKNNQNLFKNVCNGKIHLYTNIKWYPFNQKDVNYIFLKLEGFPTYTRKHFSKWIERWGPKKKTHIETEECSEESYDESLSSEEVNAAVNQFVNLDFFMEEGMIEHVAQHAEEVGQQVEEEREKENKDLIDKEKKERSSLASNNNVKQCDYRREDERAKDGRVAPKDGYSNPLAENPYRNYFAFKLPNSDKTISTNETYIRKGDDFFIPQELSEYLLDSAKKNVLINFKFPEKPYTLEIDRIMQKIHKNEVTTDEEKKTIEDFKKNNVVVITENQSIIGGKYKLTRKKKGKKIITKNTSKKNTTKKKKRINRKKKLTRKNLKIIK